MWRVFKTLGGAYVCSSSPHTLEHWRRSGYKFMRAFDSPGEAMLYMKSRTEVKAL